MQEWGGGITQLFLLQRVDACIYFQNTLNKPHNEINLTSVLDLINTSCLTMMLSFFSISEIVTNSNRWCIRKRVLNRSCFLGALSTDDLPQRESQCPWPILTTHLINTTVLHSTAQDYQLAMLCSFLLTINHLCFCRREELQKCSNGFWEKSHNSHCWFEMSALMKKDTFKRTC